MQPTHDGGNGQAHGSTKQCIGEDQAVERDEHKERIQLSGHRRNRRRPQQGMPTNKPSRCVRLKALKSTSKTKRKDTVVSLEP